VKRGKHPTFNVEPFVAKAMQGRHPTPNIPAMSECQPLDVERWMLVVGCFPFDHLLRFFGVFRGSQSPFPL
jgi:hypothetical protein